MLLALAFFILIFICKYYPMRSVVPSLLLFVIAVSACSKKSNTTPKVMTHQDTINAIVARLPKNFFGMRTQTDLTHHHFGTDTIYNFNYTLTFHYDTVYHNTTVIEYAPPTATFIEDNETITFYFPASAALPVSGHYMFYKLTDSLVWQVNDPGSEWIFRGKKM